MADTPGLRSRVRGKWQIPLLLGSGVALGAALWNARSEPLDYSVSDALGRIDEMIAGGAFEAAARFATGLLDRPQTTPAELAPVHLRLARALAGMASGPAPVVATTHRRIAGHFSLAHEHEQTLDAGDHEAWAKALEHEGLTADAIHHYELSSELSAAPRWDNVRRALHLRRDVLQESPASLHPRLEAVIAVAADDAQTRLWALEELVDLLHEAGLDAEAVTAVARLADAFEEPPQRDVMDYLKALTMTRTGAADEAELLVRALRARQSESDPNTARSAWLLGRILLGSDGQERPMEALAHFEESLRLSPEGPYAAAARLGLAETLTALQRDDEAAEAYRLALAVLAGDPESREVDRDVLRTSLMQQANLARLDSRFSAALQYLDVAGPLVDRSKPELAAAYWELRGDVAEAWARLLQSEAEAVLRSGAEVTAEASALIWQTFITAADSFLELARISFLEESRAAETHFKAAELYAAAPARGKAAQLFATFVAEHPSSPRVGQALLRLGQVRQAEGEFQAAMDAYRDCAARFPRTLHGSQALLPLAQTYLAIAEGPEDLDLADHTLDRILQDSEIFRPESREFAEALFLRGQIASLKGEHERAIAVLTEALDRYPQDERRPGARFLLADAYRQSGLALKEAARQAVSAGEGAQIREDYLERLEQARTLFRDVIDAFETRPVARLDRLEAVYYRHALLFEADCLFESVRYADALKLYQTAAGTLADTPAVLVAYVQIINCHVFLGQKQDARTALTRALVQLERIPDAAFEQTFSKETRDDWKRYFEWMGKGELF